MNRYPIRMLGDLVLIEDAKRVPLSGAERQNRPGPYPYFGAAKIFDHIDDFIFEGDRILVGEDGSVVRTDGRPYVQHATGRFWVNNHAHVLCPIDGVDFYFLKAAVEVANVRGLVTGAAQPKITQRNLCRIEIPTPDEATQQKIGSVLRNIEDLVKNNGRRIELLEETARLLYQEWFVNFRYPGHEDVPLVDSELGPIPGDWEICQVDEVTGVVGGGTPSKKEEGYWVDGTIQWYTPSDLTATESMFALGSSLKINELGLAKSSANLFPAGSVMMTSRATIGELSFSTTEACTNQGFITCVPSERLSGSHIYFWLEAHVPLFLKIGTGATFKELTKSTFRKLPIAVPPVPLEEEFCSLVDPLLQSVLNLLQQQQVLQSSRDLLLPRLVSGDLDISDLDLDLEAAG